MLTNKLSASRRAYTAVMRALLLLAAVLTAALVVFMIVYVLYKGLPYVTWHLISTKPSYITGAIGILPDICNTVQILLASLLIVLPLGVGAAVYLTEYAQNKKLVAAIEYAAETLSGIPSIIYGLVGMLFFCEFLGMQTSLLAGALTLVIMNLPTVLRTTQESLRTVPQSYREGAFGLGAGKGWLHNVGAADTDLVFALVSEEWGLILAVTLVAAIAVLAVFVVRSAPVGRSCFYTIGACAAVTILVTQAILNVFGTVDILPLTGVTFPFVSNGGSSMLCVWGLLAFVKAADTRQNASFAIRLPGRKGA